MKILEHLKERGIFKNITNEEKLNSLNEGAGIYIGFDPTAESLHLGNYVQIATLLRFKEAGFKPIAVLGGATGMIGDPSGKSQERNLLSNEQLINNKNKIRKQLEGYGLEVVDNYDFYKEMNVLSFLRDVGKLININYMLNKDVVASRLDTGISFTEFSYQLIQGWDFKELYDKHDIKIQVGGSDQWGNITAGVEIIRKVHGDNNQAVGITTNLLTTSTGKKFGKSEGNAIWIDKNMTSPYSMYQYLLNTNDDDLKIIFNWLTFLTQEHIDDIVKEHNIKPFLRHGQKKLAFEIVKDVYSEVDALEAEKLSNVLFSGGSVKELSDEQKKLLSGSIPTIKNTEGPLLDILVALGAAKSKNESRKFINSKSIELNGELVEDENAQVSTGVHMIKRGKKKFFLLINE